MTTRSDILDTAKGYVTADQQAKRRGPKPYPVRIRGVEYPSARAAGEALGVSEATVRGMVCRGRADLIGIGAGNTPKLNDSKKKPFSIGPYSWASRIEAARGLGFSEKYFLTLIRNGRTDLILAAAMRLEAKRARIVAL